MDPEEVAPESEKPELAIVPPQDEEPAEPESPVVATAFLVIVRQDGKALATKDFDQPFKMERVASLDDMRRASAEVVADIDASRISQMTVQTLLQVQQAQAATQAEEAQMQAVLHKINGDIRARG